MSKRALVGADIFDGLDLHIDKAVLIEDQMYRGISEPNDLPTGIETLAFDGGTLMPGFVDLQVNGGGGVMFNDETSLEGVAIIAEAHASTGTHAFLPTLITDTPDRTRAAVDAVERAISKRVPGVVGIHLEGPHLSISRKGAHDPSLIRQMDADDLAFLCDAARRLPNVMATVAPENVSRDQITKLSRAGVIVSLGHTDCSFAEAIGAFASGARCATHLFNAMSQIGNREPGLVGAALQSGNVSAGLIADDIHVHAACMRLALSSKRTPGRIFLVTDAMSTVGSDITEFRLNGRRVLRRNKRLTLEDGTLAGADLEMPTAISILIDKVGVAPSAAYAMATSIPAAVLNDALGFGEFRPGKPWRGIHLDQRNQVRAITA